MRRISYLLPAMALAGALAVWAHPQTAQRPAATTASSTSAAASRNGSRGGRGATTDAQLKALVQAYLEHSLAFEKLDKIEILGIAPPDGSGIRKVSVLLAKGSAQTNQDYYITPDEKEILVGNVMLDPLSADPWASNRARLALAGAPATGPENAEVTIVEFSDLECPFCKELSGALTQLMAQEAGKVRVVFKYFPMVDIHPWSMPAAEAAACVNAQSTDAFWKFEDATFQAQDGITPETAAQRWRDPASGPPRLTPPELQTVTQHLRDLALQSGAGAAAFDACMASSKSRETVEASIANGKALGVSSTPTMFINGRMIPGAFPEQQLQSLVDGEARWEATSGALGAKSPSGQQCGACAPLPPIIHH